MKKLVIKFILWTHVVSLMAFIFVMSSEPATDSSVTSGNTLRVLLNIFYPSFKEMDAAQQQEIIEANQHFIRKTAHFSLYTVMGILVSLAVAQHIKKFSLISYAIGTLYAVTDEIHQLYVPGRSGQLSDVLLDCAGVLLGCIIIFILYRYVNRKKAR